MKATDREPTTLTASQRKELRGVLTAKRDAIRGKARAADARLSEGREAQAEDMDAATQATEEAEQMGIADQDRSTLALIDRALAKFEAGTYGICEESEEPIGYARLRAVPWARRTAQEEELRERRRR